MVHLLRDREFGNWSYQNALNGNIKRCSKHRMWQACENDGDHFNYYDHFNECRLLFFVTCQGAIHAINDALYNETTTHAHESLQGLYILNVVKLTNDIYIEMRNLTEIDNLRMTIDVKKIIPKLSVPLENEEWEILQNMKWGPLINETYDNIIDSVGYFTDSATRELKSKTSEDIWEGRRLKRDGIIITSVTQRSSNRFYYLEPRFKTKENELLRPDSTK